MKDYGWLIIGAAILLAILGGSALVSSVAPPILPSLSDLVKRFATAIAHAEGFFINGSVAQRNNNPGNIRSGGQFVVYSSIEEGWQALYALVDKMFSGNSLYYRPSMTISQVAFYYADATNDPSGAANWANNVASYLGVTTDTTLDTLMGA